GEGSAMTATVPALGWADAQSTYGYDATYRLTSATYPNVAPYFGQADVWTYDAIGNRTTATTNGTTTNYTYQKIGTNGLNWQKLLAVGTTSFAVDDNGNTISMTS